MFFVGVFLLGGLRYWIIESVGGKTHEVLGILDVLMGFLCHSGELLKA